MEKRRLKVLSYNIHKGFSFRNRFILNQIRDLLCHFHPDLVLLQEVLGHHEDHRKRVKDWPSQPQFEFLAHELWPHYAYGRNAVYSKGHHGNAILSKYPIRSFENIDISTQTFERRGILHGEIELPWRKKPLHALCIHLGLFEADRKHQIQRLCSRIQTHVPHLDPLVIGGDFNDWKGSLSLPLRKTVKVEEAHHAIHGHHARTFPSWLPSLRLDRIYYRGLSVKAALPLNFRPWSQLSDHVALVAEMML